MIRNRISLLVIFLLSTCIFNPRGVGCSSIDTPTFYRTPMFQGDAKLNVSDWTTHIDLQYAHGSTNESWNCDEVKVCLFNAYGSFDMRKLAANIENIDSFPKTKAYADGSIPNLTNGKLKFGGDFSLDEYNITIHQNLLWGLYIQAYLPIRDMKIKCINHMRTNSDDSEYAILTDFVNNDLDAILDEHGIKPLKTCFERTQLADPVISLGWHGHCTFPDNIISKLRGYIQAGIIIPHGSRKDEDQVFSLPTGYNKHWGVNMRGNLHATIWNKVVLGASAGTSVFWQQSYCQRVTTSCDQRGWILLEKRRANTDLGTIWDAGGYVKGERILGGLSLLAGYSYTRQEKTLLDIEDGCYLQTACNAELIKSKKEVLNANKLDDEWYHHALHLRAEYDLGAHTKSLFSPIIRASYDYPLAGKNCWPTEMLSGNFSLVLDWCF